MRPRKGTRLRAAGHRRTARKLEVMRVVEELHTLYKEQRRLERRLTRLA